MSQEISSVKEQLRKYLISIGFNEVTKPSFEWSGEHADFGLINFHSDGKAFGMSVLSSDIRDNCGYSPTQRRALSKVERERIYRRYLEKKPYYTDIKYGLNFHFRKSATDYIGLSFGIGYKRLINVIKYELNLSRRK